MKKFKLFALTTMAAAVLALSACGGDDKKATTAATDNAASAPASEAAETIVMKVAFNQPEDHPEYKSLVAFGEKLKAATNGRYTIEVFPNELLGAQKETMEMVQNGSLPFSLVAGSLMENWNPDFAVLNLPYVFKDYEHLKRVVIDDKIVGELYKSVEDKGLRVLCAMYTGTRNVYTKNKPIQKPEDLKGLKIRVMQADTMVKMMNYMGGTGTPMSQGEVYTAIQTGVLDGAENNEVTYYALKQHEVGPIYSRTGHLLMPDYLVTNPKYFDALPDDVKKFFADNIDELVNTEFQMFQDEVKVSMDKAIAAGAKVYDADIDAFKKAVEPLIKEKVNTPSAQKLYDAIQATRDVK